MGVDYYCCEKCKIVEYWDYFPRCINCADYEYCGDCVDKNLLIFSKDFENYEYICDECIRKKSVEELYERFNDYTKKKELKITDKQLKKKLKELKNNIPSEESKINEKINEIEKKIKELEDKKEILKNKLT